MIFPHFRRRPKAVALALAGWLAFALAAQALNPAALMVEIVGGGTVSPNYNGQVLTNGNRYSMTAKPLPGFVFTGWTGSLTSSKTKLTFTNASGLDFTATFVDRQRPTVKISTVTGSGALTTNSFYVSGTARDNDAVTNVFCRLKNAGWTNASTLNVWSNWWFTVSLLAGTNQLEAYAVDASGNASKTNTLKLIYSVAPLTLNGSTLVFDATNAFNFGTNGFTGIDGVGTYTYKKLSSIFGRISLIYTAPPSATGASNNATILLQFTNATEGTFSDVEGNHAFSLAPANGWAPPALTDSSIVLSYDDGINEAVLTFPGQPLVATNNSNALPNPLPIPLNADYPGQFADRVIVTFSRLHYVSQFNTWVPYPAQGFVGTVIDPGPGAKTVTVLFDSAPKNTKADQYSLAVGVPLNIITCTYDTYANSSLLTSTNATFTFTNTSPDGALLQLNQSETRQYVVMNFTNDSAGGNFYEEDYQSSNPPVARSGIFLIALAPQIVNPPASVSTTNGGTASFSVQVSGTPPLSLQWRRNGTNLTDGPTGLGSTISGSITTNLVLSNVTTNDIGSYSVAVSNTFGNVTSSGAALAVTLSPVITSQPTNVVVTNGMTARFNVAASGVPPLAYQWQFNGTNLNDGPSFWSSSVIFGSLTTQLSVSPVGTNDLGNYRVIVSNNYGSVTSRVAALTYPIGSPPVP